VGAGCAEVNVGSVSAEHYASGWRVVHLRHEVKLHTGHAVELLPRKRLRGTGLDVSSAGLQVYS
jgi:hypothetical protein